MRTRDPLGTHRERLMPGSKKKATHGVRRGRRSQRHPGGRGCCRLRHRTGERTREVRPTRQGHRARYAPDLARPDWPCPIVSIFSTSARRASSRWATSTRATDDAETMLAAARGARKPAFIAQALDSPRLRRDPFRTIAGRDADRGGGIARGAQERSCPPSKRWRCFGWARRSSGSAPTSRR